MISNVPFLDRAVKGCFFHSYQIIDAGRGMDNLPFLRRNQWMTGRFQENILYQMTGIYEELFGLGRGAKIYFCEANIPKHLP
ncbi:hypothetical protein B0I27_10357 [Arcticibacter pallidicorallinus]|uniref:Uncharacterized protein n=1 Tax=Arcticibacter pallidicorallinus TaxID=1259464 RepID=A0A2T0U6T3_9SPHI|nr:hypothetical protein [Arcticibacter pallidicorallinus]PRY53592.1 hypothetical protein B0I27_10357 [Arcticibacter pallidicorallinus]